MGFESRFIPLWLYRFDCRGYLIMAEALATGQSRQ